MLMQLVKQTVAAVVRAYGVTGVKVWQNNGVTAHQSVPPRISTWADAGAARPRTGGRLDHIKERRNEIARRVAAAL